MSIYSMYLHWPGVRHNTQVSAALKSKTNSRIRCSKNSKTVWTFLRGLRFLQSSTLTASMTRAQWTSTTSLRTIWPLMLRLRRLTAGCSQMISSSINPPRHSLSMNSTLSHLLWVIESWSSRTRTRPAKSCWLKHPSQRNTIKYWLWRLM